MHGSADALIYQIPKTLSFLMKQKLPKFKWSETFSPNAGHDKNEWGVKDESEEKDIVFFVSYTIKDDLSKVDTSGFVRSHL